VNPLDQAVKDRPWCDECGTETRPLTAEWIVPPQHGGQRTVENVTVICDRCINR
jgi:hypothetical protein